ncbi:NAD(P)H-dependent FMN reductase [Nocardiopsis mwathae]|uniref:NAD(P)H-dependent FMN reductase n=1 Tax=Nocardiopsis mwathae TaxID=1472723 RepID=A0A7X0D7F7_9ACTN|nr:NAD(P)H-dependent oxidoreductase [Nocardiopsis mwathae]MBB6174587.1 NAD(P)H-dependent FMN reductase [Nocardiopsis mwathae]
MSHTPIRVAVIMGSTRDGRFIPTISEWIAEQARQHGGLDVDVVDLAEARLPDVMTFDPMPDAVTALAPRLRAADAFIVVTPEYNHSFPAPVKTAIDWYHEEWQAKPVAFVSYGGMSGGLRAVEQLRQVFAELHATTVRETVSFHNAWDRFDAEGRPLDPESVNAAAKAMLDQLSWWAEALREARDRRPYAA